MGREFRGKGAMVTTGVLAILMAVSATTARADGPAEEGSSAAGGSVARPEIARLGDHFRDIYLDLQYQCPIGLIERPGGPINMPTVKRLQSAMDCVGFRYGGKARRVEFKFADDILDLVIIPTKVEEQESLLQRLIQEFGEPSAANDRDTVFMDAGVLLRTDPHSVVFFSDRMKDWYGKF